MAGGCKIQVVPLVVFIVVFVGIVAVTRYVSLGSLVVVVLYFAVVVFLGQTGVYDIAQNYLYEMYGIAAFLMVDRKSTRLNSSHQD